MCFAYRFYHRFPFNFPSYSFIVVKFAILPHKLLWQVYMQCRVVFWQAFPAEKGGGLLDMSMLRRRYVENLHFLQKVHLVDNGIRSVLILQAVMNW